MQGFYRITYKRKAKWVQKRGPLGPPHPLEFAALHAAVGRAVRGEVARRLITLGHLGFGRVGD